MNPLLFFCLPLLLSAKGAMNFSTKMLYILKDIHFYLSCILHDVIRSFLDNSLKVLDDVLN